MSSANDVGESLGCRASPIVDSGAFRTRRRSRSMDEDSLTAEQRFSLGVAQSEEPKTYDSL